MSVLTILCVTQFVTLSLAVRYR